MSYDNAGNLTNDTYSGAGNRTYDAENKIVSAWGGNNQAQLYSYDANGQRVRRTVDGVETWQIYGIDGVVGGVRGQRCAEQSVEGVWLSQRRIVDHRFRSVKCGCLRQRRGGDSLGDKQRPIHAEWGNKRRSEALLHQQCMVQQYRYFPAMVAGGFQRQQGDR
jgi:YD repeat-containing protein